MRAAAAHLIASSDVRYLGIAAIGRRTVLQLRKAASETERKSSHFSGNISECPFLAHSSRRDCLFEQQLLLLSGRRSSVRFYVTADCIRHSRSKGRDRQQASAFSAMPPHGIAARSHKRNSPKLWLTRQMSPRPRPLMERSHPISISVNLHHARPSMPWQTSMKEHFAN